VLRYVICDNCCQLKFHGLQSSTVLPLLLLHCCDLVNAAVAAAAADARHPWPACRLLEWQSAACTINCVPDSVAELLQHVLLPQLMGLQRASAWVPLLLLLEL
jgi:hypothetical protein